MKIICVGDNNVDIYPEEGIVFPGGNCINVAAYVVENGGQAAYLGNLGRDAWGEIQERALLQAGVQVFARWQKEVTSNAVVRHVGRDRRFEKYDNEIHIQNPIQLTEEERGNLRNWELLHSSRYSVFARGELESLSERIPISYDFSNDWEEKELEQVAPYLTYAFLSCDHLDEAEIEKLLEKICALGCQYVIATKGSEGAYAWTPDGILFRQMAFKVNPIDTIGAGDSFIARFLQVHMELKKCYDSYERELKHCGQQPDLTSARVSMMQASLSQAALYAARNCMRKGAFSEVVKER